MLSLPFCERQAPYCVAETSQVRMNSLLKSPTARHGLETNPCCNFKKDCLALSGSSPIV